MIYHLVAAGIGGRTVREAEQNLSTQELHNWRLFFAEYGSPWVGDRLDLGFARISYLLAVGLGLKKEGGGKWSVADFMPPEYSPDEEDPATIDEIFTTLTRTQNGAK